MTTVPETSLRERSKAKRRASVQRAAMRLFAERGYDGTTIAEIAEAAELAPRTVSMYFPSKLDIAMSAANDIAARLTATFQAHPDLTFTEVVDRWLVVEQESKDEEFTALLIAMYEANPDLRAVSTAHLTDAARFGGPSLLDAIGLAADDPMAAIVGATVGAAITQYLSTTVPAAAVADTHRAFMAYLRAVVTAARPG